jgi:hypothetical protein
VRSHVAFAAFAFVTLPSAVGLADALPLDQEVRLGSPPRAVRVRVESTSISVGPSRTALPSPADEASLERIEVAAGHGVAVARWRSGDSRGAALIVARGGRPEVAWTGRLDLHGDPGERVADVLSTDDRTGDGRPDVVVGVQREGASLCAGPETILFPRAYDPASATLRPVALRRLERDGAEVTVTATRASPGPSGPPLLSVLRFTGASSTAGHGEEASGLGPPQALSDGDPRTYWSEGRGGPGAGEFVVARFDARMAVWAVAVTAAAGPAGAALGRPRTFSIVGDTGPRVRVTMPEDAGLHAGERYWIRLPEPASWRCVALVLDEAYAPAGVSDDAVHTGLGEVELYTELDFGRGLDGLVAALVEGRDGGDEVARLLAGLGAPAVRAVTDAWERLDAQGRRRAVRVFAEGARRGVDEGVAALGVAGRDEDENVRTAALEALGTLGPAAGAELAQIARGPGGDAAIRPLLRHDAAVVVPALLAALDADGGPERAAVREGLAQAVARGGAERAIEEWLLRDPSVGARASAALGLSANVATRGTGARVLASAIGTASGFEDRWRLVQAARDLPPEPEVDAWLAALVSDAQEWMLRGAAMSALGRRDSPRRVEVARAALADAYPRVRVEAVHVLDLADAEDTALAERAREDSWPMVRAAAVEALWDRAGAENVVRGAIRDRSARVRRMALGAVTRRADREAWPLVRARLLDGDEWPQVTAAALTYVRELCLVEADEAVGVVLQRGLAPSAWQPDVDVAALAVDVALAIGGGTAEQARQLESRPDAPAALRAALQRARERPAACASSDAQ